MRVVVFSLAALASCSSASAQSVRASSTESRLLSSLAESFITDIKGVIKTETYRESTEKTADDPLAILLTPRLVGDSKVSPGAYPYFCRVDKSFFPSCGGTLVAPDVVLTAAHCSAENATDLSVLVNGYHDKIHDGGPHNRFRKVTKMVIHPKYSSETYYNDVMLLKLNQPVPDISPVVLNRDRGNPSLDDEVTVVGLGALYNGRGYPDLLQSLEVDMISNEVCSEAHEDVGMFAIDDNIMFCAGKRFGAPAKACHGDSGGPLLDKDGVQIGVTSQGLGCSRAEFPGVYTRTAIVEGDDWLGETLCSMTDALGDWCSKPITGSKIPESSQSDETSQPSKPEESSNVPCEDTPNGVFTYFFEEKTCSWLSTLSPTDIAQYCELGTEAGSEARFVCQKTCRSCGEKPASITTDLLRSSVSPAPQGADLSSEQCVDNDDIEFVFKGKRRTCKWLRDSPLGQQKAACLKTEEAYGVCRKTCTRCSNECKDYDLHKFPYKGKTRSCTWLRRGGPGRIAQLCVEGEEPYDVCRVTCGACSP